MRMLKGIRLTATRLLLTLAGCPELPQEPPPSGSSLTPLPPYFLLPFFPGRIPEGHPAEYILIPPEEGPPALSLSVLPPETDEAPEIPKEAVSFLPVRDGRANPTGWALFLGQKRWPQRGPQTQQGTQDMAAKLLRQPLSAPWSRHGLGCQRKAKGASWNLSTPRTSPPACEGCSHTSNPNPTALMAPKRGPPNNAKGRRQSKGGAGKHHSWGSEVKRERITDTTY